VGARHSTPFQTGFGAHPASYKTGTGSFPRIKQPGRGVNHPPPSSSEDKERVEPYLYSSSGPSSTVTGRTWFLLTLHCKLKASLGPEVRAAWYWLAMTYLEQALTTHSCSLRQRYFQSTYLSIVRAGLYNPHFRLWPINTFFTIPVLASVLPQSSHQHYFTFGVDSYFDWEIRQGYFEVTLSKRTPQHKCQHTKHFKITTSYSQKNTIINHSLGHVLYSHGGISRHEMKEI
jgi:hypothetical protein